MAATPLTFRLATEQDADVLENLINKAFLADRTTQVFLPGDDRAAQSVTSAASMRATIARPDCAVLVATDTDGTLVAHCTVRRHDDRRSWAWFGLLAVDERLQGRGLGGQMLAYTEEYAQREFGAERLEFSLVNTRAELIAFYSKRGYRPTGATTPFPYDSHPGWENTFRADLHFVVFGKDVEGALGSTAPE